MILIFYIYKNIYEVLLISFLKLFSNTLNDTNLILTPINNPNTNPFTNPLTEKILKKLHVN